MSEFKKGATVTIFEDPLTQNREEGKARLVKFIRPEGVEFEWWEVRFEGERRLTERKILTKRGFELRESEINRRFNRHINKLLFG